MGGHQLAEQALVLIDAPTGLGPEGVLVQGVALDGSHQPVPGFELVGEGPLPPEQVPMDGGSPPGGLEVDAFAAGPPPAVHGVGAAQQGDAGVAFDDARGHVVQELAG